MLSLRIFIAFALFFCAANVSPCSAQGDVPTRRPEITPWGVSSSASAYRDHAAWFPKMAAAGVTTVRLFPEWRTFEPKTGTWKWDVADALVKSARDNNLEITAVLMGSPPGMKAIHAFPMDDLDGWAKFVANVVGRYKNDIRYWEVWNEGNGGFNDAKHTTADYAKLATVTYDAAKKADPKAQVGLTVASFDAPYLQQTLLAMAKAGTPNKFDYLCIHPYEIADGLASPDGEIPFLWMNRTIRDVLKAAAPEKANADLWITEVGNRLSSKGHVVNEQDAANALVKIYTMAIAQGIQCTQWFEAQDPIGEDQGFGLLARDGSERPSYKALKALAACLGANPRYVGWVALGPGGRGYGFVFEGKTAPVLVAWMPAGQKDNTLTFSSDAQTIDPARGLSTNLKAGEPLKLTDAPLIVTGVSAELVKQARGNATGNFPWGGDHSKKTTVSFEPGAPNSSSGIALNSREKIPTITFPDGSTGILVQGDIAHPVSFHVHPSFANIGTKEYFVRASVRRIAPGNVGMNLIYEVADSQGRAAYVNAGKWFGTTKDAGWQTYTWHVTNAAFSKMWGNDFVLRPEQSVPFAIGKVEVSTEPFR